jgi:hypothetical protein
VLRKSVLMQYLPTYEKIADVLTKPLAKSKFEYFRDKTWSGIECTSLRGSVDGCSFMRHSPGHTPRWNKLG